MARYLNKRFRRRPISQHPCYPKSDDASASSEDFNDLDMKNLKNYEGSSSSIELSAVNAGARASIFGQLST